MKKKDVKVVNKGIDTTEMLLAIDELEKTNGIKKDFLMESIESALVVAYKRNFDCTTENVKVVLDKSDGKMHVYQEKNVVEELEKPENEKFEITLENAKKIDKNYEVGDVVQFELMPKEFGRIAAQTAKQVITQKIREASRDVIFNEFADKKGEIITGLVQKADGGAVILDLGRIEGIMPRKEQIPTERYRVNDKIKTCIISVEKGVKGSTQIILSRASTEFIRKLFEIEIPEIYEGLIEIKSISRDAGSRSKIAVYSPNPNIDPVGSCVGQKGIRIQNIINELNGEKIDVIEWNEDPSIFISTSLLPAKVLAVDIREDENFAQVIVPDDQLSLAIGKGGQNARLAAKLTDWRIDIKSESQFRQMLEEMQNEEENGAESEEEASDELKENVEETVEVMENEEDSKAVEMEETETINTGDKKSKRKSSAKKEDVDKEETKKSTTKKATSDKSKEKKVTAKKDTTKKSTKSDEKKAETKQKVATKSKTAKSVAKAATAKSATAKATTKSATSKSTTAKKATKSTTKKAKADETKKESKKSTKKN